MARPAVATAVRCDEGEIILTLADGRAVRSPLTERLHAATPEQRARGTVVDFGTALHWPDIDEDLSVAHLIGVSEDELYKHAGFARGS